MAFSLRISRSSVDGSEARSCLDTIAARSLHDVGVAIDYDFAAARAYYRRALALDRLDTGLQQLARIGESARR